MNEFMNQYIIDYKLDKRHDSVWVLIKVQIPKDVFDEYFKKETYFTKYFPYGKIVFKESMFIFNEENYVLDDRLKLENI